MVPYLKRQGHGYRGYCNSSLWHYTSWGHATKRHTWIHNGESRTIPVPQTHKIKTQRNSLWCFFMNIPTVLSGHCVKNRREGHGQSHGTSNKRSHLLFWQVICFPFTCRICQEKHRLSSKCLFLTIFFFEWQIPLVPQKPYYACWRGPFVVSHPWVLPGHPTASPLVTGSTPKTYFDY